MLRHVHRKLHHGILFNRRLGFKVPTLYSRFKISGDMTKPGCFHFGFVLLCEQQNQSGTKTFRIHHESGTIPTSVS